MKRILLLQAILLIAMATKAQMPGKWQWLNPSSTSTQFFNIEYVGSNTWYAAGMAGTVVKSTDDGATWKLLSIPAVSQANYLLEHSSFVSPQLGFISNGGTVYKTMDGGLNWTDESNTFNGGSNIKFVNQNIGWKGLSEVLKTTDGGKTWNVVTLPGYESDDRVLYQKMFSETGGILFSKIGKLYKTSDGNTWSRINNPTRMWGDEKVVAFDATHLSMFRESWTDTLFHTVNGSSSWTYSLISNTDKGTRTAAAYANASTILIALFNYNVQKDRVKIARSSNGGSSWTYISIPEVVGLIKKIEMKDANTGIAIGTNGAMIKTTDGGLSWTQLNQVGNITAEDAAFRNDHHAVLVGHNGVLYSRDGGKSYQQAGVSPTDPGIGTSEFNAVTWLSDAKVLAMGYGGYAYFSNDTGATFTQGNYTWFIGTFYDIAYLPTAGKIIAVGRAADGVKNYTVSTNGGNSWTAAQMPGSFDIQRIYFFNEQLGFATGADSAFYATKGLNKAAAWKTTNGGTTWTPMVLPGLGTGYSDAKDVCMLDANNGWMVGTKIWKTTNGGSTWTEVSPGIALGRMLGVYFEDAQHGHIIGQQGYYIYTEDGGSTWKQANLHHYGSLKRFFKRGNALLIAAEGGGMISNDGTPSTGIESKELLLNAQGFNAYPNPVVGGELHLAIPEYMTHKQASVELVDIQGKTCMHETISDCKNIETLNVSALPKGLYLIRLEVEGNIQWSKILLD